MDEPTGVWPFLPSFLEQGSMGHHFSLQPPFVGVWGENRFPCLRWVLFPHRPQTKVKLHKYLPVGDFHLPPSSEAFASVKKQKKQKPESLSSAFSSVREILTQTTPRKDR